MKTLSSLLLASLALAVSPLARADASARAWLENYYLDPQPAAFTRHVAELSRDGYFEQSGHTALAIGFVSTVFAQNPAQVEDWLFELRHLPASHQRLLAAAAWQAELPFGAELLRAYAQTSPIRAEVERLASAPALAILDTQVNSPSSMNLHWGAFLASGQEKHITRVLEGIGNDRPALDAAARVALAQHAAEHPRVLEICRSQLDRQPEEVRSVLRAALRAVDGGGQPRS